MVGRRSHGYSWKALLLSANLIQNFRSSSASQLGCFSYGYKYDKELANSEPTTEQSPYACQQRCRTTSGCKNFGWFENGQCYLGAPDSLLISSASAVVAGPSICPKVSEACVSISGPGFPGKTPQESMAAWPPDEFATHGQQPTSLQCWPRRADGFPMRCKNVTATVLEDTVHGWSGRCDGLIEVTDLSPDETCQRRCMMSPLCGVWSVKPRADGKSACYNAMLGSNCYKTTGPKPLRAQRIKHGTYRILMNSMGMEIVGLTNVFPSNAYPNQADGIKHCKLQCLSFLLCQHWQYHKNDGCWIEDPRQKKVGYPLVNGVGTSVNTQPTSRASQILAGEYIQHNCIGPKQSIPVAVIPVGPTGPSVPVAPAHSGNANIASGSVAAHDLPRPSNSSDKDPKITSWPLWAPILIFVSLALCIGAIGAGVWMGMEHRRKRAAKRQGGYGGYIEQEQSGLLSSGMGGAGMATQSMGAMPWPGGGHGGMTYSGVPGYNTQPGGRFG
eukprot:TRINITY_DN66796_c0_g1_i1.p1 TRINITY_DN66796_c0_g1~~TRINITY_DN66796_c0_g1_i1.p1  ORF type:complete len:500 (-),score=51.37 TRINITY_DN66796_c0_g1_i1:130-1629(-)